MLLTAEQDAQHIVNSARTGKSISSLFFFFFLVFLSFFLLTLDNKTILHSSAKTARLRQAKDEAEREVQLYRTNMEAEYQKMISDVPQHELL